MKNKKPFIKFLSLFLGLAFVTGSFLTSFKRIYLSDTDDYKTYNIVEHQKSENEYGEYTLKNDETLVKDLAKNNDKILQYSLFEGDSNNPEDTLIGETYQLTYYDESLPIETTLKYGSLIKNENDALISTNVVDEMTKNLNKEEKDKFINSYIGKEIKVTPKFSFKISGIIDINEKTKEGLKTPSFMFNSFILSKDYYFNNINNNKKFYLLSNDYEANKNILKEADYHINFFNESCSPIGNNNERTILPTTLVVILGLILVSGLLYFTSRLYIKNKEEIEEVKISKNKVMNEIIKLSSFVIVSLVGYISMFYLSSYVCGLSYGGSFNINHLAYPLGGFDILFMLLGTLLIYLIYIGTIKLIKNKKEVEPKVINK